MLKAQPRSNEHRGLAMVIDALLTTGAAKLLGLYVTVSSICMPCRRAGIRTVFIPFIIV